MESYGKLWRIRRQLSDLAQRCSRMFKDVFKDVQSQTCESHVAFPVSSSSSSSSASSKSAREMQATEAFASALAHVALALKFQRYSQREIRKTFIFMILTIFTPVFLAFPWHFLGISSAFWSTQHTMMPLSGDPTSATSVASLSTWT